MVLPHQVIRPPRLRGGVAGLRVAGEQAVHSRGAVLVEAAVAADRGGGGGGLGVVASVAPAAASASAAAPARSSSSSSPSVAVEDDQSDVGAAEHRELHGLFHEAVLALGKGDLVFLVFFFSFF